MLCWLTCIIDVYAIYFIFGGKYEKSTKSAGNDRSLVCRRWNNFCEWRSAKSIRGGGGRIGVGLPTRSEERWIIDGNAVKEGLENFG
jgi:hypothetical protein